jgi:hypothetical protein
MAEEQDAGSGILYGNIRNDALLATESSVVNLGSEGHTPVINRVEPSSCSK